jgi:long-subunit acyl-CoA synthetase (AMP-forming)
MARLRSSKTPDKTALLDGGRVVSYAQLDHRSNRIANTLLAAVFGCDFVQFYGTTETFIITLLRPEQHRLDNPDLLKSCGQPMPGVDLRIVDRNGRDQEYSDAGEVLVRSPWMFTGYWNKPDATAAAILNGWYHTGDAGIRDKDGNLFLVDRLKDMIKHLEGMS